MLIVCRYSNAGYDCRAFLELEAARAEQSPERHFVFADKDSDAYINAKLDDDGNMSFSIRTRDSSGQLLNPQVRAVDLFDGAMRHFGSKVKSVRGDWSVGQKEAWLGDYTSSTNLEQFNAYLREHHAKKGDPTDDEMKEAARNTWTGKQAARYGFKNVSLLAGSQDDSSGNHSYMSVEFTK